MARVVRLCSKAALSRADLRSMIVLARATGEAADLWRRSANPVMLNPWITEVSVCKGVELDRAIWGAWVAKGNSDRIFFILWVVAQVTGLKSYSSSSFFFFLSLRARAAVASISWRVLPSSDSRTSGHLVTSQDESWNEQCFRVWKQNSHWIGERYFRVRYRQSGTQTVKSYSMQWLQI